MYAHTFPQLVVQGMRVKLHEQDILRLRTGYDLTERMADGLYRSQGCPFVTHLVRTSSIVLAHGGGVDECLGAMLHSAYMLDCFAHSRRRKHRSKDRAELAGLVGDQVEEIVWQYYRTGWGRRDVIANHVENFSNYGPVTKSVLLIRLANELEDYLDLAVLYRPAYSYHNRIASMGSLCIELARLAGVPSLGQELEIAYQATLSSHIPSAAVRRHINAYELPRRHHHERNMFEYALSKAGKIVNKIYRYRGTISDRSPDHNHG